MKCRTFHLPRERRSADTVSDGRVTRTFRKRCVNTLKTDIVDVKRADKGGGGRGNGKYSLKRPAGRTFRRRLYFAYAAAHKLSSKRLIANRATSTAPSAKYHNGVGDEYDANRENPKFRRFPVFSVPSLPAAHCVTKLCHRSVYDNCDVT